MNVEIGAEAAIFPEKEYISGIFVAVQQQYGWYQKQIIHALAEDTCTSLQYISAIPLFL